MPSAQLSSPSRNPHTFLKPMIVKSISYQVVKNLGNYESERLEVSADVEEGEKPKDAVMKLRQFVHEEISRAVRAKDPDYNPLFDDDLHPDGF